MATCRICNNPNGNQTFVAREMMYGLREEFGYILCAHCGCLPIAEVPQDLSRFYPPGYYSHVAPKRRNRWRES